MGGRTKGRGPVLDRSVPVLVAKVGHYPLHHGGLGAARSLGRLGVPVHAVVEDRWTPLATSRYLRTRLVWPTTGTEPAEEMVDGLLRIGRGIGRPAVLLPTDDEAAVLVAEHAQALAETFVIPAVPPDLPRRLADKGALYQLCRASGTPTPATASPETVDELLAAAAEIGYPVVVKNAAPWARLQRPAVGNTTVVRSEGDLRALAREWAAMPSVLVQEYLPLERSEDWVVGVHRNRAGECRVFTGVKLRAWPPHAGVTTLAVAAPNPTLVEMTTKLCDSIGYRGVGDLDWRFDLADGRYKLLDFNPRLGAQFRLFETEAGVDLVRALHLDLTGRPVPPGGQVDGRALRVENLDVPAAFAYRGDRARPAAPLPRRRATELAFLAADDPLPGVAAAARSVGPAVRLVRRGQRPTNS